MSPGGNGQNICSCPAKGLQPCNHGLAVTLSARKVNWPDKSSVKQTPLKNLNYLQAKVGGAVTQ